MTAPPDVTDVGHGSMMTTSPCAGIHCSTMPTARHDDRHRIAALYRQLSSTTCIAALPGQHTRTTDIAALYRRLGMTAGIAVATE